MLIDSQTDPPEGWRGMFTSPKGRAFELKSIPGWVPFEFSITLSFPQLDNPTVFVRAHRFDDEDGMDRLLAHEGRHVDQQAEDGMDRFTINWMNNGKRMKYEAQGHAENVIWHIERTSPVPIEGMSCEEYYMLRAAADIDQTYHIRGRGIEQCYRALASYLMEDHFYQANEWGDRHEQLKQHFKE
jgi:hypothetical protein